MNGLDPDNFDPLKYYARAQHEAWVQGQLRTGITVNRLISLAVGGARYFVLFLLVTGMTIFFWLSAKSPTNSYSQSVYLELSSGFAFFVAAPFVIELGRMYRRLVPISGICFAGTLLYTAYLYDGFLQMVLIEFSIAILTLVGLELSITPVIVALDRIQSELLSDIAEMEADLDE